jgi:hypothetical protein
MIRRFQLIRHEDPTGTSGTGLVAEGCIFTDGVAVTHWLTSTRSTVTWHTTSETDAVDTLKRIHGHQGLTEIRFLED